MITKSHNHDHFWSENNIVYERSGGKTRRTIKESKEMIATITIILTLLIVTVWQRIENSKLRRQIKEQYDMINRMKRRNNETAW